MQKDNNNRFVGASDILTKQSTKIEQIMNILSFNFNTNPIVSVIRLSGIIGDSRNGFNLESTNEYIEKAFKKSKVTAVFLVINSPGGSPVQSEFIANRIISLSKEKGIKVYSFVEDVAASGGYWLACAGDEIYASKSSIIGSIGVISRGFGFQEAISKLGIERRVYTAGSNKSVLDPFEPAKASDIKMLKGIQKQVHTHFVDYVKSRRKGRLTQTDSVLFNGEFWAGESALDFGLIDGICDMYSFIRENFGEKAKIEYIGSKPSWLKRKIGIEVSIDGSSILDSTRSESIKNKFEIH